MTNADFAAAQRRVLARRKARAAASAAAPRVPSAVPPDSLIARLPQPLQSLIGAARTNLAGIASREGTSPAFRVGQVDAELLDEELLELLKGQVGEALKYYGTHLRDDWVSEIGLALRAVLFKLSIWDHEASYGAALQNLRYTDARHTGLVPAPPRAWQKVLYGLLSVGGRYGWEKWEDHLLDLEGGYEEPSAHMKRWVRITGLAGTAHTFAATANFLVFLVNGRYRTLLDRILRLRLTPTTSQVSREVSFEYLNRQLVWHAFTEFLLFLLPLVGISRWRKWLSRAWRKVGALIRGTKAHDEEDDGRVGGELGFLPERTCAICYKDQNPTGASEGEIAAMSGIGGGVVGSASTDITNPYEAIPCGDVYCYVCLAQRLEAEDGEGWTCLRCGETVNECKPWNGDVVEDKSRSSSGKSVSFAEDEREEEQDIASLEPMPEEDERTAQVAAEMEEALNSAEHTRSLEESSEWEQMTDGQAQHADEEGDLDTSFLASASLVTGHVDDDDDDDDDE